MTVTKPMYLDETGQEQNRALWAIAHTLRGSTSYSYEQILDIIADGAGSKMFPVGTQITVQKEGGTAYPFKFMHHGQHSDGRYYAHLRLMRADHLLQYDKEEAFYYAESGLAAGNYNVQVTADYGSTLAGYYNFTLASAVPEGGQLVGFAGASSTSQDGKSIKSYASSSSTTEIETATITRSDTAVGTTIGVLAAGGDENNANMNSIQRAAWGSNNWAQSAARQFLNSAAAAGFVWTPKTKFDRPPTWATTQAGFKSLLPDDFLAIVNPVSMDTDTNNVFESDGYTKNSSYSTKDAFWLPSRYQIFGSVESHDLSETQWQYYVGASDVDRIMYDAGGTARSQWLRSPLVGYAHYVRDVTASGALSYGGACGAVALAPACEISLHAAS